MKPTIAQRAGALWRGIQLAASARSWEGGEIDRRRSRPPRRLISNDTDLAYGRRESLISEARNLCQTFGICNSILSKYANYTVGNVNAQWITKDTNWNKLAEENFKNWMAAADVQGLHSFQELTKIAVQSWIRDGDTLGAKVLTPLSTGAWPQIQMIEADRVTNASGGSIGIDFNQPGENRIIGGIRLDRRGARISYTVCERNGYGGFINPVEVDARNICHIYDPRRFEAYRGVTHFNTVLNDLRDLKEIKDAEKIGVKNASRWAMIVKTFTGGPKKKFDPFANNPTGGLEQSQIEEIEEGIIQYMFPGEEAKAFASDRPSAAWQGFIELLIRGVAIGLDLPFEFVWNMAGLTGPAVRMTSKQAERTFTNTQEILERRFLNPIIAWVTAVSMEQHRIPFNPDWMKFYIQRPAMISIDAGRESTANLNEYKAGVLTGAEIAGERGRNIYDVIDQRVNEAVYRKQKCLEAGIEVSEISEVGTEREEDPREEEEPLPPRRKQLREK